MSKAENDVEKLIAKYRDILSIDHANFIHELYHLAYNQGKSDSVGVFHNQMDKLAVNLKRELEIIDQAHRYRRY